MPHHSERETKMKTRQGFVSNSSTSSFFIVMKSDQFDKCVEKDAITKEEAEEHVSRCTFLGENVVVVENMFMMDGAAYDWSEEMWEFYYSLKEEPDTLKGGVSE